MVVRSPDLVTAAALMEVSTEDLGSLLTFCHLIIAIIPLLSEGKLQAFPSATR